jgi:hypothetical protein
MLAGRIREPCEKWGSLIPLLILLVMRTGFERKRIDVTQGDLIFSPYGGKHPSKPGWTRRLLRKVRSQSRG